jgi:hypothetical protein
MSHPQIDSTYCPLYKINLLKIGAIIVMVIFIDIMRLPFGYCLLAAWIIPKMELLTANFKGLK